MHHEVVVLSSSVSDKEVNLKVPVVEGIGLAYEENVPSVSDVYWATVDSDLKPLVYDLRICTIME